MTEPRIESSLADLKFRGGSVNRTRSESSAHHFWTGVAIFLGVALAYPFYSYRVHDYLVSRDVEKALVDFTADMNAVAEDARRESQAAAGRAAARAAEERMRGVMVAGTTIIAGNRIVIVSLGQASLPEAKAVICQQAAVRFREPLAGERLRIQQHRGSQPALDIGTITCD